MEDNTPRIVLKLTEREAELLYELLVERMFNGFKPVKLQDDDFAILDLITDLIDAQI